MGKEPWMPREDRLYKNLTKGKKMKKAKSIGDVCAESLEESLIRKAEIAYDGKVPIVPPPVRPVLILSGSDYEMGYQYGKQRVQIFGPYESAYIYRHFKGRLTEKNLNTLKIYQEYVEKQTPWLIDFMKGIADGSTDAGVVLSFAEVLAYFVRKIKAYPGTEPPGIEQDNDCSGFAAWGSATKDGKLIFTGSGDHEMHPFEVILMFFPKTGNNFMLCTDSGAGYHPGMNNKGLVYAHHGSGPYGSKVTYGIPVCFATMNTLRFANNANEALNMQLSYTTIAKRAMGIWADIHGNGYVIESNDPPAFRKSGDYNERDFLYASNPFLIWDLGDYELPHPQRGLNYVPQIGFIGIGTSISGSDRSAQLWNLLHNYHGEVDLEFIKMMWRFPGKPPAYPTLEEADAAYIFTQGTGWNIHVGTQDNSAVVMGKPDDGDKGLYYVSNGSLCRASSPFAPRRHAYRVAPIYSFYQLQLAASPGAVVSAARDRAQYDLYYANLKLSKLNYWDTPYAPLNEIFNRAAAEWRKGFEYQNLAGVTTGSEDINYYSKALRGFTSSQAFAKQVYNALVPPAARPENLGFREWLGDWGDWLIKPEEGWIKHYIPYKK